MSQLNRDIKVQMQQQVSEEQLKLKFQKMIEADPAEFDIDIELQIQQEIISEEEFTAFLAGDPGDEGDPADDWEEFVKLKQAERKKERDALEVERNALSNEREKFNSLRIRSMASGLGEMLTSTHIPSLCRAAFNAFKDVINSTAEMEKRLREREMIYAFREDAFERTSGRFDDV